MERELLQCVGNCSNLLDSILFLCECAVHSNQIPVLSIRIIAMFTGCAHVISLHKKKHAGAENIVVQYRCPIIP